MLLYCTLHSLILFALYYLHVELLSVAYSVMGEKG